MVIFVGYVVSVSTVVSLSTGENEFEVSARSLAHKLAIRRKRA